ncbi:hypothetical protein [Streptomyces sp. WAC06614]|uniref:hypothetical protein n=1 Tax=Streptomyces sp. WAC06614 TaxID=2487416 RepID=UPI000F76B5EF|nr:hypothetical protein [Streptomyces sp. WAC06614]RSS68496.1 hypothetical protein EF918_28295 [Streptomyces sp. WAC06614]
MPEDILLKVSSESLTKTLNNLEQHLAAMELAYKESEDIGSRVARSMVAGAGRAFVAKIENWQRGYRSVMAEYKDLTDSVQYTSRVMADTADEAETHMDLWTGDVYDLLSK